MKIKYIHGNGFEPIGDEHKVIAHSCNDCGGWGRGLVLEISKRWPQDRAIKSPEWCYREWHERGSRFNSKPFVLGQIDKVLVEDNTHVCNMIAQRDYRTLEENGIDLKLPNVNYSSLYECLTRLRVSLKVIIPTSINMPRIGAGLGKGNWSKIETIINQALGFTPFPVYVYDLEKVPGTIY